MSALAKIAGLQKLADGLTDLRKRLDAIERSDTAMAQRHAPLPDGCSTVSKSDDSDPDDRRSVVEGLLDNRAVLDSLIKQARGANEGGG